MDWLPAALSSGGPWAILGGVIATVLGLIFRGALVPGTHVDRLVKAYEKIIEEKRDEATAWRAAHAVEAEGSRVLREQNGKLLEHSSISAHAWDSIRAVAESRGADAP